MPNYFEHLLFIKTSIKRVLLECYAALKDPKNRQQLEELNNNVT